MPQPYGTLAGGGGGGGGHPPPQVVYPETPGQKAMKRRQAKGTVRQPGPFSGTPGKQAPVPFGQAPIHGNPSAPVPFKPYSNQ
jgi:hypothetical protein